MRGADTLVAKCPPKRPDASVSRLGQPKILQWRPKAQPSLPSAEQFLHQAPLAVDGPARCTARQLPWALATRGQQPPPGDGGRTSPDTARCPVGTTAPPAENRCYRLHNFSDGTQSSPWSPGQLQGLPYSSPRQGTPRGGVTGLDHAGIHAATGQPTPAACRPAGRRGAQRPMRSWLMGSNDKETRVCA